MTFAEQVNIERKSYFLIRAKDVIEQKDKERKHAYQVNYTIAYQACHYFLGLPDGQIKYLQVLIAVTESVCLT